MRPERRNALLLIACGAAASAVSMYVNLHYLFGLTMPVKDLLWTVQTVAATMFLAGLVCLVIGAVSDPPRPRTPN